MKNFPKVAASGFLSLGFIALTACFGHLAKYTNKSTSEATAQSGDSAPDPIAPIDNRGMVNQGPVPLKSASAAGSPTIFPLDKGTFRFNLKKEQVFESALDVLVKNYNLVIVDKEAGIITTEWDSFYLDNVVYRNKVSLRIKKRDWNSCEVAIHNSVERLQNDISSGTMGAVWLPSEDKGDEVSRLVKNMAIALNQPPPYLPTSNVAESPAGNTVKN